MSRSRQRGRGKTGFDRVLETNERARRERDRARIAAADPPCTCGAITARDPCPFCGGPRPENDNADTF